MCHRKVMLNVYDYEVSAAATVTYRQPEKGAGRGSKPMGQKYTQFLAKDSYGWTFSSDGLPISHTSV